MISEQMLYWMFLTRMHQKKIHYRMTPVRLITKKMPMTPEYPSGIERSRSWSIVPQFLMIESLI
jgi:hypothetical protein